MQMSESDSEKKGPSNKNWLREPMLWFLLSGAVLYGFFTTMQRVRKPKAEVTAEWLQALTNDFERRGGKPMDSQERIELAHRELEEEILFREALKEGRIEDNRVRALLAALKREELEPVLADPTDAELAEYREQHPAAYQFPEQMSFQHLSFVSSNDVPAGALERLRAGDNLLGDARVQLANPQPLTWMPQIKMMFGDDFSSAIEQYKINEWNGPVVSQRGVHFIKVLERKAAREMSFSEVKPALTSQWLKAKQQQAVSAKVKELSHEYRIVLPEGIPQP